MYICIILKDILGSLQLLIYRTGGTVCLLGNGLVLQVIGGNFHACV